MWVRKTMEYSKPPVVTHKPALHSTRERGEGDTEKTESNNMVVSSLSCEHLGVYGSTKTCSNWQNETHTSYVFRLKGNV